MKLKYLTVASLVILGLSITSCEYDNYDSPSYIFSGQLKSSDGENFPFDANRNIFRFFQEGYGKVDGGMNMRVNETGAFRQLLFNADYKLTLVNQPLPFEFPEFTSLGAGRGYDSLYYHITGNVVKDFEIRPYYRLSNLSATLSGGNVVARFDVEKMTNTTKEAPAISRVRIYLGTSSLVNSGISCNLINEVKYIDGNTLEASIPVSMYRDKRYYVNNFRTYAYYRVAIELEGMPDYYLFSEIQKLDNIP